MNRIQLNVRASGVSSMGFCPFLNQILSIVRCCIDLTRGRSNTVEKNLVEDSNVKVLHFLMLLKVFLWLWNDASAKLELDKN